MVLWVVWLHLLLSCQTATSAPSETLPGCEEKCGNISVPYPFGIINGDRICYREKMELTCNHSFNPPKLFLSASEIEVLEIALQGQVRINNWVAYDCYDQNGEPTDKYNPWLDTNEDPFTLSDTRNRFIAVGCDTLAYIIVSRGKRYMGGCVSICDGLETLNNGTCSGIGCCQASIPKGVKNIEVQLQSYNNHTFTSSFNPCSFGFLVEHDWYNFSVMDLYDFRGRQKVPMVLDWAIGNKSCEEAQREDPSNYACGENSHCSNSTHGSGYLCNCNDGYQGNPYLSNRCKDIDECANKESHDCEGICTNTPGSYYCTCPDGTYDEGEQDGRRCIPSPRDKKEFPVVQVTLGIGLGLLFLFLGTSWLYWGLEKRRIIKLKEKFFEQNGGSILKQRISTHEGNVQLLKIFTTEELEKATNNYDDDRILGHGGYGTVYKGILADHRIVAIKKSKIGDKSQIDTFINEIVVLSQINHRNVVRLLGCCLETEVPLLIYEFINNGTLFHHIHKEVSSISWGSRLRIATETAGTLDYLHAEASIPIIHRDIKYTNIVLDKTYTAKVSDFGASRLVPKDQTQLTTLVQGTYRYLDPEYIHTSQLTEKSDVYSFGVVLVELLTGKKAISYLRPPEERNLSMHFISSLENNRLFEILEHKVVEEGKKEQLEEVAELAKRCLKVNGKERPTMKEVTMELERLRRFEQNPWVEQVPEESVHLLAESLDSYCSNTVEYYSMKSQLAFSIDGER